jgi:hypothetical protein
MKKLLLSIVSAGILVASCSKKDDPAPTTPTTTTPTIPTDGWKLGATSYTSVVVARTGPNSISAFDAVPSGSSPTSNTLNVFFSAFPTASGTFAIVQYPSASPLTATQIGVTAAVTASSSTYASTGTDGISATVTVSGGKIKVELPEVWVKKTGSGSTDSLKVTGTVTEP